MKKKHLPYLLSAGHMSADLNQGALPAILPFLITSYNYNFAQVAGLVLAANIVSSIVQPLFGQIADKKSRPWIMAIGLLLGGAGMAGIGFISNFTALCISVMISGLGIAAFHPEAALLVNKVSEESKKGSGISIFSFGGNIGFAIGPVISTVAIMLFGLKGTLILLVPALVMCIFLFMQSRNLKQASEDYSKTVAQSNTQKEKDQWFPFSLLSIVVFGRSIVFYGLNTFLSLYWINVLNQSESLGNTMLSVFFGIGAISTLAGGKLADRYGFRKIIIISYLILFPSIFLLTLMTNVIVASVLLFFIGFSINMPYSPIVVLGQKYLPNRLGLASGVTLGLSVSVGGIVTPVLGKIADNHGLLTAMHLIAAIAIVPAIVSFTLPKLNKARKKLKEKAI